MLEQVTRPINLCRALQVGGSGHPPTEALQVLVALWCWITEWVKTALLGRGCKLVMDSCSMQVKCGGDLTRSNSNNQAERKTRDHIATIEGGTSVACAATVANINDKSMFRPVLFAGVAAPTKIRSASADKGHDAKVRRMLCLVLDTEPHIHNYDHINRSELDKQSRLVERTDA